MSQQGPYCVSDDWGVHLACGLMLHFLDQGYNAYHVQYETVRKMRSFYSNYAYACLGGTGVTLVSSKGASTQVSNVASNSIWFQRFM